MSQREKPAGPEVRARLKKLHEEPMPVAEFLRLANLPLTQEEIDEARALRTWFLRRYPTPAERLAYARRAYRRWVGQQT